MSMRSAARQSRSNFWRRQLPQLVSAKQAQGVARAPAQTALPGADQGCSAKGRAALSAQTAEREPRRSQGAARTFPARPQPFCDWSSPVARLSASSVSVLSRSPLSSAPAPAIGIAALSFRPASCLRSVLPRLSPPSPNNQENSPMFHLLLDNKNGLPEVKFQLA